eukprot:symbB.v1.2.019835.t2/scaffold1644.1/size164340/5
MCGGHFPVQNAHGEAADTPGLELDRYPRCCDSWQVHAFPAFLALVADAASPVGIGGPKAMCATRTADLNYQIKTAKTDLDELSARISKADSKAEAATSAIQETQQSIAGDEADLKAAGEVRQKESAVIRSSFALVGSPLTSRLVVELRRTGLRSRKKSLQTCRQRIPRKDAQVAAVPRYHQQNHGNGFVVCKDVAEGWPVELRSVSLPTGDLIMGTIKIVNPVKDFSIVACLERGPDVYVPGWVASPQELYKGALVAFSYGMSGRGPQVAGDGDCLFHALAFFDGSDGGALRIDVADFMEQEAVNQPAFEAEWLDEAERVAADSATCVHKVNFDHEEKTRPVVFG